MTLELEYAIALGVAIAAIGLALRRRPMAMLWWAVALGWFPGLAASLGVRSNEWILVSVAFAALFFGLGARLYLELPRKPIWYPDGVVGLLLVAGALWLAIPFGWFGLALAAAVYIALVIARGVRNGRALRRVTRQLVEPTRWNAEPADEESMSTTYTVGLWKGLRVWLNTEDDAIELRAGSQRWPSELALAPGSSATGDARFDAVIAMTAEPLVWRPVLSASVRDALIELFTATEAKLTRQDLTVFVRDPNAVETVLDLLVRLQGELPDPAIEPEQRVFDNAAREPDGAMRLRGYRWLVERGWRLQDVKRAASTDPDPAVTAWAREQLPASDGIFR